MCTCGDGFLFLGSRLGNSLLLKYTEKSSGTVIQAEERITGGPVVKKRKIEGMEQLASDVTEIENLDELEVYGSTDNHGTMIASYSFEVCDNIWNIAPVGQVAMGEPAFLSEEYSSNLDPDLELVTTSGHSKNGAISVLQHSIRPQVVTTFSLSGCVDLWTVYSPSITQNKDSDGDALNQLTLDIGQYCHMPRMHSTHNHLAAFFRRIFALF